MRISLPKTVRFLTFREYDPENPELAGVGIHVWVDPPRAVLQEYDRINREFSQVLQQATGKPRQKVTFLDILKGHKKLGKDLIQAFRRSIYEWYARLWSQGPEGTHWDADEVAAIDEHNPAFLEYMEHQSWALVEQHRTDIKKGLRQQVGTQPVVEPPTTPS